METLARLQSKVVVNKFTGCHEWVGYTAWNGYGYLFHEGHNCLVHRLAWKLSKGPIKEGLVVDQKCRVRRCCNPDHMELVTTQENVRRGLAGLVGKRAHTQISFDKVQDIRGAHNAGSSIFTLAAQYRISPKTVSNFINYRRRVNS